VNALKILPALVLLIIWARLLTWADKDSVAAHLPREILMAAMLGGLIFGFALFFLLPNFLLACGGLVLVLLAEIGTYLILRNAKVGLADLKGELASTFSSKKVKEVKAVSGAVQFVDKRGSLVAAPTEEDPNVLGYQACQQIFTTPLQKEAEQVELIHADGAVAARFIVDGVTYSGSTLEKGLAGQAIAYVKEVAGMDTNERRKPQSGSARVSINGKRREMLVSTRGTTAGETMSVTIDPKNKFTQTLDNAGLMPDQVKKVKESIAENTGVVLVAAPSKQGLTSALYALIRGHDAFLQHILTIERDAPVDLEGITQNKLPANATPADEYKQVSWVISQQPDVILMSDVHDPKSALELLRFAKDKRVYVGMRAGSTFEALNQWRKLVGDNKAAVSELQLVIAGRVVRKLCMACKVSYAPDPGVVKKLGLNPDRAATLFQARTQPLRDPKGNPVPCEFCLDLRYKGRVGVFETLIVDDDVRSVVAGGGSENQLKAVFRKQRGKYLQEEALGLVEAGETSVQEVLRVLKVGSGGGGGDGGRDAAPAAPPTAPAPQRSPARSAK
jgi:type II secretory ATPase GspE/PulE/Tfp pilus assembly ATPase PilB-like protein